MSQSRPSLLRFRRRIPGSTCLEASPVQHIVRQLWSPLIERGAARLVEAGTPTDDLWQEGEEYRVVPSWRRARLLVPGVDTLTTSAALTNYRGLRPLRTDLQRMTLGTAVRLRAPALPNQVALQRRVPSPGTTPDQLPLQMLARVLGVPELFASIGIRPGANGKATLQLIERGGAPVGFAKFGWSPVTDEYVRNEATVLERIAGGQGRVRVPTLLTSGSWFDHPFLVSSPLPTDARGARSAGAVLGIAELADLCPLVDRRVLASTQHLASVRARVEHAASSPIVEPLVAATLELLEQVERHSVPVPVTAHWHGDLTPWNTARDVDGRLWCWDWESSEADAAAGLDALHWMWSVRRERGAPLGGALLRSSLRAASEHLRGLAVPKESWTTIAALYALTVVERSLTLAVEAGGWQTVWIKPSELGELVVTAAALLAE